MRKRMLLAPLLLFCSFLLSPVAICKVGAAARPIVDVLTEDHTQFTRLLSSSVPERRVEGIQGLSHLKHWPAEERLLPLLEDKSRLVRREALLALCRMGTAQSIPHLIRQLKDPSWELRQNAWIALRRMTAQPFGRDETSKWQRWWDQSSVAETERQWLSALKGAAAVSARRDLLRALRHFATAAAEPSLIGMLDSAQTPPLEADERGFICETLDRIGSPKAIPALAAQRSDPAAWALGRIGGPEAERALLNFPKTLATLLALDRLQSTNAGAFIPHLVADMGLVTYRGQPDDVMDKHLQPVQRAAANLIRRSGLASLLTELVLQELEDSMIPPISHAARPDCPRQWDRMLQELRQELKPGFVRGDGATTSQPLAAMCYIADDPRWAKRLIPLLRHPAFVPRIYVALTLGRLHAKEALPAILEIIREGYAFSDAVALASGKHFEQSQTVRWRGFLCIALGRMGGDEARLALETLATDPEQPRDVRYGSAIGLTFISSPKSLPALRRVAQHDVIWMVRDQAQQAMRDLEIENQEAALWKDQTNHGQ